MDFSSEFTLSLLTQPKPSLIYDQKVKGKTITLDPQNKISTRTLKSKFSINRVRGNQIQIPSHQTLVKLNELWKDYVKLMNQPSQFLKMDLHGSLLTVIRSSIPPNVGLSGFCIRESQNMFYIVINNQIKAIPKRNHVFTVYINNQIITIFGNQFCFKPAERINKKFKSKPFDAFY
jgi:RNase P/RNase MRP subunit p29